MQSIISKTINLLLLMCTENLAKEKERKNAYQPWMLLKMDAEADRNSIIV